MSEEQKAAVVNARCATALIRAMGMQARNQLQQYKGEQPTYHEADFNRVIEEEGVSWNSVHGVLFQ